MINAEMFLVNDLTKILKIAMRDGYGEGLTEAGKRNEKVVVLVADLMESTRTDLFKAEFPERFFEMGISEQNMMGVAAGMAACGKVPFVNSFACFNPGRNWEQLRLSVCLSGNNVKVVGGHAGFGNGTDGGNQQMFEDIALARVLPHLTVVVPADYEQAKKMALAMADFSGPVYMRMTKPKRAVVTTMGTPLTIGKAQILRSGKEATVFACGAMVYEALLAAEELAGEIDVEVINVHTIKPLDKETILGSARKTKRVVTAEEHSIIGGLGGAIAELLSEEYPAPMKRVGMGDKFGETGEPDELLVKYGMTKEAIIGKIRELL
ncbi:MAG: transketolase C-terminal domain-containing protein [Patescibacteria group bacterium]